MQKTIDPSGYVFKRSRSPFYYARWWLDGKEYVQTTKKKTKPEAEVEKARFVAQSKGHHTVQDAFDVLLDTILHEAEPKEQDRLRRLFAKRLLSGSQNKLTVGQGWQAWLDNPNKKRTPKEKTILSYGSIWRRFESWAHTQGLEYFHEVTRAHSETYAEHLWKSTVSPSTYNAHIKLLTHFFKVLETKADLQENVWSRITRKEKITDQGRRNLSEEELVKIMQQATGNMRVMFVLGLFTGLRLGDVVNLRWDEIDHDRHSRNPGPKPGLVVIKPMKTSRLGKIVEIPIHPALRMILDWHRAKATGEFLFPAERDEYVKNPSNITAGIQAFFKSCKIETTEEVEGKERRRAIVRVGFHSLRHSFVSLCAKAGAPMHVLQKLVGHGSPLLTSDTYTHLDDEQKRNAVAPLPTLGLDIDGGKR